MTLNDSAPPASGSRDAIVALFLALGAGLLYLPTLSCGFINLDDFQYVLENAYIRHPTWEKLWWFFAEWRSPTTVSGYYQPLTMASLMLDRVIEGASKPLPEPFVYHATNVLLHMANCALVFAWLRRFVGIWPAAVAAALFAVHPMNVEAVTWVCQRKTLLAAMFCLVSLLAYDRYARGGGRGWLVAATLSFVPALLSKPTSWSLPLFLILLDVWPYGRRWTAALIEKLPMLLLAAVFGWIAYVSQAAVGSAIVPDRQTLFTQTPLIICHSVVFYFYKLLWPMGVCPQYPAPPLEQIRLSNPMFAAGVIGVAALAAVLIVFRRQKAVWVCVVGYLLLINPVVLGAVKFAGSLTGDRFVYLPMIALLLGGATAWQRHAARAGFSGAGFAAACVVIVGLSWRTWVQQPVWNDSLTYWTEVVRNYPADSFSRESMGRAWLHFGQVAPAEREFAEAIRLNPRRQHGYILLGQALIERGQPEEALKWLRRGLDRFESDPDGNFYMGLALAQLGRYAEAVEFDARAVELMPSWPEARFNLGNALLRSGRSRDAVGHYERLVALIPDNAEYLYNFAIALVETGQDGRAYTALREAKRLRPDDATINFAYAACAAGAGDQEAAWPALETAVAGDPEMMKLAETEPRFGTMRSDPRWPDLRQSQRQPTSGRADSR